jgi:hypothetical protein
MNPIKQQIKREAAKSLFKAGLKWKEFSDTHWRVNEIDFWPTTDKWLCPLTGETEFGVENLIKYIKVKSPSKGIKTLSVEQMFDIARKHHGSLFDMCKIMHKEIYGI